MNVVTDPKQAGERLLQFVREGRLVQGEWLGKEDGREIACLLGAAAGIDEATQCPASLMPQWVAHALPGLFDGQSHPHAQTFARRWGEAMLRDEWRSIDWDAVRGEWLAFIVKQAKVAAAAALPPSADAAAYAAYVAYAATRAAYTDAEYAYTAHDAQADALMNAIEKAMEVARG